MNKLLSSFKRCLLTKKMSFLKNQKFMRYIHEYNFDTDEEIVENRIGNVLLIGMNLPDRKNALTGTAVEKLTESINNFGKSDDISVAILHGIGGNFCTGLEDTEKAVEKSRSLMEALHKLRKPIIGALSGYTKNFGFHLAIMCDIRVMEETALAGFGEKLHRSELQDFVIERLVLSVGLAKAVELISLWCCWPAKDCYDSNFINRSVSCGCSLGQSVSWAQNIAKDPVTTLMHEKSKILSAVSVLTSKHSDSQQIK